MVVNNIYGRFAKTFILVVADGLEDVDTQALALFHEFYVQYVQLVEIYNTRKPTTLLIKNVGIFW